MSGARPLAALYLLMACVTSALAAPDPAKILTDDWELVERVDLPDGVVQLRVRPKAQTASAAAGGDAKTAANESKEPVAKPSITDSLKGLVGADLSVPSSPAMAVLGMTGTEVQRPAFPRDFAASLVRGFNQDGKTKNAIAIDIVPASLFFPRSLVTTKDYKKDHITQLLARTTVSLASAQVEGDTKGNQMAAGMRIGLIDDADPGLYAAKTSACVSQELSKLQRMGSGRDTKLPEGVEKFLATVNKECALSELEFDLWAKPALYAGYAQGWYSASGAIKDAGGSAKALWMSYSIGHGRTAEEIRNGEKTDQLRTLLQLHLARRLDERVKDPADAEKLVREDRSEFIARLRFGRETWHGYLDGGVARVQTAGIGTQNVRRIGLGFEYQLRDDLWLVAGSVRERGYASGDRTLVSTGLRFGQAPGPIFAPPGGKPKETEAAK